MFLIQNNFSTLNFIFNYFKNLPGHFIFPKPSFKSFLYYPSYYKPSENN